MKSKIAPVILSSDASFTSLSLPLKPTITLLSSIKQAGLGTNAAETSRAELKEMPLVHD